MFDRIDVWLTDVLFQPLPERLHRRTGKSRFWYAAQGNLIWLAILLFSVARLCLTEGMSPELWVDLALLPLVVWAARRMVDAHRRQEAAAHTAVPGQEGLRLRFLRGLLLLLVAVFGAQAVHTGDPLDLIALGSLSAAMHFACCAPLPPSARPLRKAACPVAGSRTEGPGRTRIKAA